MAGKWFNVPTGMIYSGNKKVAMHRILFMLMVLMSFSASAAPNHSVICRMEGEIFETIARARNQGVPPDTAYKNTSGYLRSGYQGIDEKFLKNAVNMVYFDPEFADAGGPLFRRQMTDLCLHNARQQFQPLE